MSSSIDELQRKAALAKSILDDVVDSSSHEDEKVARLLYTMSFLTVATAIAFSAFLGNRAGAIWFEFDLVSILFLVYLVFLAVGTIIVLEAMSPRLHLFGGRSSGSGDLDSMHFFKSIARKSEDEWVADFANSSSAELLARERENTLRQAHFLAKKVTEKTEYIRKAKWIMVLAALCLVAMVGIGLLSYLR